MTIRPISDFQVYIVQPGEGTWSIAAKLAPWTKGTPAFMPWFQAFAALNGYPSVVPGQALLVDPTAIPPEPTPNPLLLPPDGKIMLGVSLPSNGLAVWRSVTNVAPTIEHHYSSRNEVAAQLSAVSDTAIALLNYKPTGAMGPAAYQAILDGAADSYLDNAAAAIVAYGKRLFFAPMHEPENDDSGAGDALYARAWRYTIEHLRARGADFVSVWNMMGFSEYGHRYDTLYPGDDVVDWIGWNPYIRRNSFRDFEPWTNISYTSTFPGFYSWAEPKGKPMMLCEWGIAVGQQPTTAPHLLTQRAVDQMMVDMPLLRALVYWNEKGVDDYRVSTMPTDWDRFVSLSTFADSQPVPKLNNLL